MHFLRSGKEAAAVDLAQFRRGGAAKKALGEDASQEADASHCNRCGWSFQNESPSG